MHANRTVMLLKVYTGCSRTDWVLREDLYSTEKHHFVLVSTRDTSRVINVCDGTEDKERNMLESYGSSVASTPDKGQALQQVLPLKCWCYTS